MSELQYTPLENSASDLRLIRIEPGTEHEDLKCGLYTFKDYPWYIPPYRALSYVWGDVGRKVSIYLNGNNVMITENLERALRSLRYNTLEETKRELPIWIDALCIDQSNPEERDEQVRRMREIYQGAEKVVIWLGNYYELSDDRVNASMARFGTNFHEEGSRSLVVDAFTLAKALAGIEISPQSSSRIHMMQHWIQLSRLFHRPWFERLWIIQELAVATKAVVRCGQVEEPWEILARAARWIIRPDYAVYTPRGIIQRLLPLMGAHRANQVSLSSMASLDKRDMLTVLYNTQEAKCSDPRDRLFAILGVVEDTVDVNIDYSIPVQTVYRNWAINRIRRTGTLDVLSACTDSSRSGDLPSWVPDLRRPWGKDKPLWLLTEAQKYVKKDRMVQSQAVPGNQSDGNYSFLSADGLNLRVAGLRMGNIESLSSVGDAVTDLESPIDLTIRLQKIMTEWGKWAFSCMQGVVGDWSDPGPALSVGFISSIMRESYRNSHQLDFRDKFAVWSGRQPALQSSFIDGIFDQSKQDTELKDFERYLFSRVHGCQMFIADKWHHGIVAANCNIRQGDEVWLLAGGFTAFVLRREAANHRLLGPCYISDYTTVDPGPQGRWSGREFLSLNVTLV